MDSHHSSLLPITFKCVICLKEMESLWSPNQRLPQLWPSQIEGVARACGFLPLSNDQKTWRCMDCQIFTSKETRLLRILLTQHGLLYADSNRECWVPQAIQDGVSESDIKSLKKKLLGATLDGPTC